MSVTSISAAARGRLAERLVPRALEFIGVVRSEDAEGVGEFLAGLAPAEREFLPLVLAAMVDVDKTPQELLSWVTFDENGRPLPEGAEMVLYAPRPRQRRAPLQPCGSAAAAQRHYDRGERPCDPCAAAWKRQRDERRARERRQREGAA